MWPPGKSRPWGTALFATILCLMMLGGSLIPGFSTNPAFPAFFSFLPVVFWMIAREQKESDKTIGDLRARIDALETIARSRVNAAG